MPIGLKSFVVSRTTGLYGLKFAKLSASAEDFPYLISYNWSVLLQYCSQVCWFPKEEGDYEECLGAQVLCD